MQVTVTLPTNSLYYFVWHSCVSDEKLLFRLFY